jgi:hypothetical protein
LVFATAPYKSRNFEDLLLHMDFLDEILIQLQDYSQDLNFQFKAIKDLDELYHEKRNSLINIDSTLRNHNKEFGSCTSHPEQEEFIKRATDTWQELSEISQIKINIALKTRELVDSLLGKLDKELLDKKESVQVPLVLDDEETLIMDVKPINKTLKKKRRSVSLIKSLDTALPQSIVEEETYCFCRLGSFGNMIGCDNEECPIEWFHYTCVGLTEPPRGSWYCPTCALKTPVSR